MNHSAAAVLAIASLSLACAPAPVRSAPVSVTMKADEVTAPALLAAADGRTLIVGMLGHLFELPVAGGHMKQLTFGPSYDSDPALSPDGTRIAFTSNRDGSGSNIFVLDRASKRVTQITHDVESSRPAWSPDGRSIAYTRHVARENHPQELVPGFADTGLRELRIVTLADGSSQAVGSAQAIETVFYLPDGRLAWSVRELGPGGMMGPRVQRSRIEARSADGSTAVLASAQGDLGRVTLGPRGDGVYYSASGAIQWLAFTPDSTPVAGVATQENSRVALSADGKTVFFGDAGQLWRAALPNGAPQKIAFDASIDLQVQPQVKSVAHIPAPTSKTVPMRPVSEPTLSADNKHAVVMAGGFLWQQPLSGGPAVRLFERNAFIRNPAYSPDGGKLAYVASENGKRTLEVYDFASRQTKTLFTVGGAEWPLFPNWSPDGKRIVFQHSRSLFQPVPIVVVDVADGTQREVTTGAGSWQARPHFSSDGKAIYFTSRVGKIAALYRIALTPDARPEAVTDFTRHVHEGLISPDGKWFAQRRNSEIWAAPTTDGKVVDAQLRRLSAAGGRSFAFTPDSSAIVYTAGGKIHRQPLAGGRGSEIAVRIDVRPAQAAPLLVNRVRVLDLAGGRFSDEQSIFIEDGRIRWIGAEQGRRLPANVVRIDGGGRYAIPGLFDAHVHSAWFDQQTNEDSFIAFGVTSVRDTGSALGLMMALEDRSNLTALPAPRYFYSGEIMEGSMPLWGDAFYTIGSEQEARAEVRNLKAAGANFVKIYPSLPWNLQGVVSDEAHRVGLPIVGHGLALEEIVRRVNWGSTSIEHSQAVTRVYGDVHNLLAATHTPADLTLAVGGSDLMGASDPNWRSNWRVLEYVPESARQGRSAATQSRAELLEKSKDRLERIHKAHQRGTPMVTGTDSLMGGVYFGLSLHWEVAQFVDAGLPAIDALRMATQGGADLVGASKDLGSLTPGKLADMVLLDGNPLENIRNTQAIWQVIKNGQVYDPGKLRPGINVSPATSASP